MLKVELHAHTSDDPVDTIPYSTQELIDRAAQLRYDALAITLHDRQLDLRSHVDYADARRITLIPGIERTIEGRHVLLVNFSPATEWVSSFTELAELKAREPHGLVVAPHAFFPVGIALRELMDRHADLFDAVECHGMFTRFVDFNRPARRWARVHGKPMVGNGDVHRLPQLGSTYSLVDAPREPRAICEAIRNGRVEVRAEPLSTITAVSIMGPMLVGDLMKLWLRQAPVRQS